MRDDVQGCNAHHMHDDTDNEIPNHGDGAAADPSQRIREVAFTPIGAV